jgi:multidrug transporter EmrE-like cation transporter
MSTTGFILLMLTAVMTMGANLMVRAGIDSAGGFTLDGPMQIVRGVVNLFSQPLFIIGFIAYFLASLVWFRVVATEQLSVAYPLLVSLTFTFVTAGAVIIFHEPLTLRKVVGLAVILGGIAILSMEKAA